MRERGRAFTCDAQITASVMTHSRASVKVKTTATGAAVHAADQFGVSVQRCALPAQLPRTATALGAVHCRTKRLGQELS